MSEWSDEPRDWRDARIEELEDEVERLQSKYNVDVLFWKSQAEAKDKANMEATAPVYRERDEIVCSLSKLFPSHLCRHPEGEEWDDDWRWIVCVHLPTGQVTWHIHVSELDWFNHLDQSEGHWDGHTTEEKYQRLRRLKPGERDAEWVRAVTIVVGPTLCEKCRPQVMVGLLKRMGVKDE